MREYELPSVHYNEEAVDPEKLKNLKKRLVDDWRTHSFRQENEGLWKIGDHTFAIELRSFASWPAMKFLRKIFRAAQVDLTRIGSARIFLSSAGGFTAFEVPVVPLWRDAMRILKLSAPRFAGKRLPTAGLA